MTSSQSIAFLGLGVMGAPMAGHLARAGHDLVVFNRTAAKAEALRDRLAREDRPLRIAESAAEAAGAAEIVIACLGDNDDLAEVVLGERGALAAMREGGLLIDHTTVSPAMARRVHREAQARKIDAIDAPVSGGQAGAEQGTLAIMCGGAAHAFARARPVMAAYGKRIVHVGGAGAGQTAKMANQMCIAGVLAGLSEALRLAQAAGLDLDKTFEAISGGAAQSWQMDNRWHSMAQDRFDFGFAIDWMRKDLAYALEEARALGLSAPVSALVDQFYAEVQSRGGGRLDTSALITRLPRGSETTSDS